MTSAEAIVSLLTASGQKLSIAESCTAGLVSAAITDVPGSSAVFEFGFVTYSNQAKRQVLGVSPKLLTQFGAVSQEVVAEMALGALDCASSDFAIGVSGIAGPGGSEFKPEGRVCFGLADQNGYCTQSIEFGALGRASVRKHATAHALDLLLAHLQSA